MTYPDKWLRLIAIPLIALFSRHIGDPSTWYDLLQRADYYYDLLEGLLTTFLLWEVNRYWIHFFDRRYSWLRDTFRRFVLQAVVNLGLTTVIIVGSIVLYNYLLMQRGPSYGIHYLFVIDVPLGVLLMAVVNLIYAVLNIVQTYEGQLAELRAQLAQVQTRPASELPEKMGRKNLVVSRGSALVPLPTDEIAYIFKVNEYNFVRTFGEQEYRVEHTLDQLSQMLSEAEFYRINRQMIANIEAIKQVQLKEQGGFVLRLEPRFPEEVTVSKKKAAEFKAWIDR